MTSWYDIVGLDERSSEKCDGIQQSQQMLRDILRKEHESIALPYSRMMLAGFSQGGALSLYTGLQLGQEQDGTDGDTCADQEERLAGIVVMSGYLPAAKQVKVTPGLETTPIFQAQYVLDLKNNRVYAVECFLILLFISFPFPHCTQSQWNTRHGRSVYHGGKVQNDAGAQVGCI